MVPPAVNSIHHHKGQIVYCTWMDLLKTDMIYTAIIQFWEQRNTEHNNCIMSINEEIVD